MEGEPRAVSSSLNGFSVPFALSPGWSGDASGASGSQLFLRELSGFETRLLPGTRTATTPVFLPTDADRVLASRGAHAQEGVDRRRPADLHRADGCGVFRIWPTSDEIVIDSGQLWSVRRWARLRAIAVRDRSPEERIELRGMFPAGRTCSSPACALRRPGSRCSHERPGRGAGWSEAAATRSPLSRVPASWSTRMPTRSSPCLSILSACWPWVPRFRQSTGSTTTTGMPMLLSPTAVRLHSCRQTASANPSLLARSRKTSRRPGGRGSFVGCALSPDDKEAACERVDGR